MSVRNEVDYYKRIKSNILMNNVPKEWPAGNHAAINNKEYTTCLPEQTGEGKKNRYSPTPHGAENSAAGIY